MMELIAGGFGALMTPAILLTIFLGVVVGIIFGCIPGLSTSGCIALCMPITFSMEPVQGIALMMGIYIGGTSGGLISAILLNIPGTPAAMATTFDGHPMAKRGQAGKALGVGIVFSFMGGLLSMLALMLISPALAKITLKFGAMEYFAATVFSIMMISGLSGKSLIRGLTAGFIGMAVAVVGTSPVDYLPRYTFGFYQLNEGFAMTSVIIGCFAVPEVFAAIKERISPVKVEVMQVEKIRGFGFSLQEFVSQLGNFFRSAVLGTFIGILPGIGGSTASPLAYTVSKYTSKHPEEYGKGTIGGVVAAETANNSVVGGALIPMLTLGIPGDVVTSLIMSAFMLYGLNPGPLLFVNNPVVLYVILGALVIANCFMLIVEWGGIRIFSRLLTIPKYYLLPTIIVLCSVGAYCTNRRTFDVVCLMAFGMLGYVMQKLHLPLAPMIIGYVLGPMFETYLRRGLMMADDNFFAFFQRPIALGFFIAAAAAGALTTWLNKRGQKPPGEPQAPAA